jgi:hypothetical protein
MSTAELKLKLFRELDLLEKSKLEHIYGLISNYLNQDDNFEWKSLSLTQQEGLLSAIDEMKLSSGKDHSQVMQDFKNRYA